MNNDPGMQLMLNNGYYDMATPFFATDYTIHHMGLSAAALAGRCTRSIPGRAHALSQPRGAAGPGPACRRVHLRRRACRARLSARRPRSRKHHARPTAARPSPRKPPLCGPAAGGGFGGVIRQRVTPYIQGRRATRHLHQLRYATGSMVRRRVVLAEGRSNPRLRHAWCPSAPARRCKLGLQSCATSLEGVSGAPSHPNQARREAAPCSAICSAVLPIDQASPAAFRAAARDQRVERTIRCLLAPSRISCARCSVDHRHPEKQQPVLFLTKPCRWQGWTVSLAEPVEPLIGPSWTCERVPNTAQARPRFHRIKHMRACSPARLAFQGLRRVRACSYLPRARRSRQASCCRRACEPAARAGFRRAW